MKVGALAVVITNKSGTAYQVALTKDQGEMVEGLIVSMHGGKINVTGEKLSLTLEKKGKNEKD